MSRLLTAGALALGLCFGTLATAARADDAVPTYVSIPKPAAGSTILMVAPTVSLGLLTAAGSTEPKDEWSKASQQYIAASLGQSLQNRSYKTTSIDANTYDDPRALQILKLNSAVTDSIYANKLPMSKLPTKASFDWSLGDGASALLPPGSDPAAPPAYALFVDVAGNYSSSGRAAMAVGMALLHVAVPLGSQAIQATLVDLKTGQVVWYQDMIVPSGTDIRTAEGAGAAVNTLLKKLPL